MFKNVYTTGFMLFIVVMIGFFITNIFFRDINYYRTSITLSAFFLPFVFALGAFFSVTTFVRNSEKVSFKEAYGRAFMPMFVGGLLSIASIFVYLNYVDKDSKDLLNYQYIESFERSLDEEYNKGKNVFKPESEEMKDIEKKYAQGKQRIENKRQVGEDMFSMKYFGYVFAGYCAFFLLFSLFFGSFFRTRTYA
ncbi:DUF4199 family protein [Chryseobacterium sp. A321]